MTPFEVQQQNGTVRFRIRVSPRASKNEVGGVHGDALRVRITAPPVDGAANRAIVKLLSKRLGVAKSAVRIVQGQSGRDKLVEVEGVEVSQLYALLTS